MPARKKDPSTRARANKASTAATLTRVELPDAESLGSLTIAQLRDAIATVNKDRPADQQVPTRGKKADLVERLAAALSPVPALPDHPPRYTEDGDEVPVRWHAQTRAWWNDVWTSPMAAEWDVSDVHNVVVVALLYDDIWAADSPRARQSALAEYRLQRADLGLSPYSRRRLEWTIETAAEAQDRGRRRRTQGTTPTADGASSSKSKGAAADDPRRMLSVVS